jgi:putative oxidoreductase
MSVAFFIVHGQDPFNKKELAFAYLLSYLAIFFVGPGKFSIQEIFKISSARFGWLLK